MKDNSAPVPYSVKRGHEGWQLIGSDGHMIADGMDARGAYTVLTAMNAHDVMKDALRMAECFIKNGVEFGYIRLPESPDPALETLPAIQAALASLTPRSETTA